MNNQVLQILRGTTEAIVSHNSDELLPGQLLYDVNRKQLRVGGSYSEEDGKIENSTILNTPLVTSDRLEIYDSDSPTVKLAQINYVNSALNINSTQGLKIVSANNLDIESDKLSIESNNSESNSSIIQSVNPLNILSTDDVNITAGTNKKINIGTSTKTNNLNIVSDKLNIISNNSDNNSIISSSATNALTITSTNNLNIIAGKDKEIKIGGSDANNLPKTIALNTPKLEVQSTEISLTVNTSEILITEKDAQGNLIKIKGQTETGGDTEAGIYIDGIVSASKAPTELTYVVRLQEFYELDEDFLNTLYQQANANN